MEEKVYTYKYPRAALTTDCVIIGIDENEKYVLLIERANEPYKGCWALPGGFLEMDETVEECATRELEEETGLTCVALRQLHTFSKVDRDPRERVVSTVFYGMVQKKDCHPNAGDDAAKAVWFKIDELPPLAFDHDEIIKMAKDVVLQN